MGTKMPPCKNGEKIASAELAKHVQAIVASDGVLATARKVGCAREVIARIAARLPVRSASLLLVAQNLNFRGAALAA